QLYLSYRYGHDLEENPDVQSLTGFSAGSSIHNYDNNIQLGWYHTFSAKTQNEFRIQWNYDSFNVIPNEPGQVGLQIFGFINNLGTNIFLPNFTITRRTEIADNFTLARGTHSLRFGGSELLRGNHSESHTFFPGRFVFGSLPGNLLSPCLTTPVACQLPSSVNSALLNSLQSANFGAPQVFQQGFGNADYPAYTRPYTAVYLQDSWRMAANFTLNYGLRYEVDSGTGTSPCLRFISIYLDPISPTPFAPTLQTAPQVFQGLFAQGLIQCTTPAPGNAACITPADVAKFGIFVANSGPLSPLTVLF